MICTAPGAIRSVPVFFKLLFLFKYIEILTQILRNSSKESQYLSVFPSTVDVQIFKFASSR